MTHIKTLLQHLMQKFVGYFLLSKHKDEKLDLFCMNSHVDYKFSHKAVLAVISEFMNIWSPMGKYGSPLFGPFELLSVSPSVYLPSLSYAPFSQYHLQGLH